MKFVIKNSELKGPLGIVADLAQKNGTMPIFANVLFRDGMLIASDGSAQISVPCAVKGDFTAPAEKLKKITSSFPDDAELTFEVKDKLTVKSGRSKLTVPILPYDQFPIPKLDGGFVALSLMQEDIKYHIGNVLYAMPAQHIRATLNSINFKNTNLLLVGATNGFEMGTSQQDLTAPEFEFAIPATVAGRLAKLMADGQVDLKVYSNKIVFQFEGIEFICPRVEGQYPDIAKAIPKSGASLKFSKAAFMETSQRASISASKFSGATLAVAGNEMTITCVDFDANSTDVMDVQYSGGDSVKPDLKYDYNILQLRDAVNSINSESVTMMIAEKGVAVFVSDDQMQRNVVSAMRI